MDLCQVENVIQSNTEREEPRLIEQEFESRDELLSYVREFVRNQGYAISIKRSTFDKCVIIGCDRGGSYRSKLSLAMEDRKRKTGSRLIECPFDVRGFKNVGGQWKLVVKNFAHNHEPSMDMSGHPMCRRFSEEDFRRIKEMSNAGIPPRQILYALRQKNPCPKAVSKTIHNTKAKIWNEYLNGRTPVQALLEELSEGGLTYNVQHDEKGCLTHLFFAYPASIKLSQSYSTLFLMDCTYKTNKYHMPLLDIIGVTRFNTVFCSCFVFLRKESTSDYIWALQMFSNMLGINHQPAVIMTDRELALMNAIQVVFPLTANLLCVWHIEKNIVAKCKSHFKEEGDWDMFLSDWSVIVDSRDELQFDENLSRFELLFKDNGKALSYIRSTWLPYKNQFVRAWTNKYPHFGNRATSKVEGAHGMLKRYLQVSTGDLCQVKNKLCLELENQFQEIKARLQSEKIRTPHHLQIPLFRIILGRTMMRIQCSKNNFEKKKRKVF